MTLLHQAAQKAVEAQSMKIGGRYNWRHQPARLVYMGRKLYPGDRRFWFQFALVDKPGECWSEVLESDLPMLEETADGVKGPDDAQR